MRRAHYWYVRHATDSPDELLMARVARRDGGALKTLYDRYGAASFSLATKIVGDRSSAEEIVQEAFWRVWEHGKSYRHGRGPFCAWLFRIVRNLAIDELRRRSVRPRFTATDLEYQIIVTIPDVRTDVVASAFSSLAGEEVRAAMTGLPEAQRCVLELKYFQGLTHREIADQLGEPLGTVHTRLRLGLRRLRQRMLPV